MSQRWEPLTVSGCAAFCLFKTMLSDLNIAGEEAQRLQTTRAIAISRLNVVEFGPPLDYRMGINAPMRQRGQGVEWSVEVAK